MAQMIEHAQGRYEVQQRPYGTDYTWCPEWVIVECECSKRPTLTPSEPRCWCGADYESLFEEELVSERPSEAGCHSLEVDHQQWRRNQDEYLRSEDTYRMELSALD